MGHTILLADDSVTVRRIVELAFRDTEIRVEAVGSGREALARLEDARPDLLLADVLMPPPAGYELCRSVKGSGRPVPVILLRSSFEPFDENEAAACGADGLLSKPFETDGLVRRVRELLAATGTTAHDGAVADAARQDRPVEAIPIAASGSHRPGAVGGTQVFPVTDADADTEPDPVDVRVVPDPAPATDAAPPRGSGASLSEADLDEVVDRVVRRIGDRVVREIAWEVVPDLAAAMIRERLRQLEQDDADNP